MYRSRYLLLGFLANSVLAGFLSSSTSNIAAYWGQNSAGQPGSQKNLSAYCADSNIDIIPISFLTKLKVPSLNLANIGNSCSNFSNGLLHCPVTGADIKRCQANGKTVLLSLGGGTYNEGGFSSDSEANTTADNIWNMFGPPGARGVNRPFDNASVNGFDLDFESPVNHIPAFANRLRALMDAAGAGYILSAAPQCPYPDADNKALLAGTTRFDVIWVQFYNNECQLSSFVNASNSGQYNFASWQNWAQTVSANHNVKVMIGALAANAPNESGFVDATKLAAIIKYSKQFSSFAGVMLWDASQAYTNNPGYIASAKSALAGSKRMT